MVLVVVMDQVALELLIKVILVVLLLDLVIMETLVLVGGAKGTGAPSSGQWGAGGAGVASNITGVSITDSLWWRWIR